MFKLNDETRASALGFWRKRSRDAGKFFLNILAIFPAYHQSGISSIPI